MGSWFPLKGYTYGTRLSFSAGTKPRPPPNWGMVTSFWLSKTFLEHHPANNQLEENHRPCSAHPKFCLQKVLPPNHRGVQFFVFLAHAIHSPCLLLLLLLSRFSRVRLCATP